MFVSILLASVLQLLVLVCNNAPHVYAQCDQHSGSPTNRARCEATHCCNDASKPKCDWESSSKICSCPTCCPVNCVATGWAQWSACSATCGGGSRSRDLIFTAESCNGMPCSPTSESGTCNTQGCPTNCQASPWSGWTCSTSCGAGVQTRSRTISVAETNGGSCPERNSLTEMSGCNLGCCPVNCSAGAWSAWSTCSVTCAGGTQTRTRTLAQASCGGSCADSQTMQTQACNTHCCPQNCQISSWSAWGTCSATCGGGTQTRSRTIDAATCGGTCSSSTVSDSQACNSGCCPQNCAVSLWTQWSACSAACGQMGTNTRSRTITASAQCGGTTCPSDLSESRSCGGSCCATNCTLTAWSAWSACSVTCGDGMRTRSRTTTTSESCGGTCDTLADNEVCSAGCCPSDCVWSQFMAWSSCSVTCGTGTRTRSRTKQTAETCGGTCQGEAMEVSPCTQVDCPLPPVDCQVSAWAEWSQCSATCGGSATKSRVRTVVQSPQRGGAQCPSLNETVNCGFGCCPVACAVSQWAAWSSCSVTCNSGMRERLRSVTTGEACGGAQCPPLRENEPCSQAACAVDCVLSVWSNWSPCSQQCGNGEQRRQRNVNTSPANGGAACGELTESRTCSQGVCSCAVTEWSTWTACSVTCGGGTATRSRAVTVSASDCPPLSDVRPCGMMPCARDCVISAWSSWSACSVSCGGGRRTRARFVTQPAVEPGMACPNDLGDSEMCNTQNCTSAGMLCSQYAACNDCTDNAKTAPHVCHFCAQQSGVGVCQLAKETCAVGIASCTPATATTTSGTIDATVTNTMSSSDSETTAQEVVVDVASVLALGTTPVAQANATLAGDVQLGVRVKGPEGATLQSQNGEGIDVGRDGTTLELDFGGRSISITRLELGSWDASDSARLEFSKTTPTQKRQMGSIDILSAQQSTGDATREGFTHYVLVAGAGSEFSLKSFAFVERSNTVTTPSTQSESVTSPPEQRSSEVGAGGLGTLEIALIAAFGGLCLIIAITVIVVVLVRRRSNTTNRQPKASSINSDNEMPSLLEMHDAPSTRGLEKSNSIYGPVSTLMESSGKSNLYGAAPAIPSKVEYSSVAGLAPESIMYESFPGGQNQSDDDSEELKK